MYVFLETVNIMLRPFSTDSYTKWLFNFNRNIYLKIKQEGPIKCIVYDFANKYTRIYDSTVINISINTYLSLEISIQGSFLQLRKTNLYLHFPTFN